MHFSNTTIGGIKFPDMFQICTYAVSCLYTCATAEKSLPPQLKVFILPRGQLTLPLEDWALVSCSHNKQLWMYAKPITTGRKWKLASSFCVYDGRKSQQVFKYILRDSFPPLLLFIPILYEPSKLVCVNSTINVINLRLPKTGYSPANCQCEMWDH